MEASLESLPSELLEEIFVQESLTLSDLNRLGQVSNRFHELSQCLAVWKAKFTQRWPDLSKLYNNEQRDWNDEYRACITHANEAKQHIKQMSPRLWHKDHCCRKDLQPFVDLVKTSQHPLAIHFYLQAMYELLNNGKSAKRSSEFTCTDGQGVSNQEDETEGQQQLNKKNLTEKYYAGRVIRYFLHRILKQKWQAFQELSPQEQHIETGAILLAQWCQPNHVVCEKEISHTFDTFAEAAKDRLWREKTGEQIDKPISDRGEFDITTCTRREILQAVNNVLYVDAGFHGNAENYYSDKNSYIDWVLSSKTGIPISMAIVYIAVARRLGINLYPINFPSHFLVSYSESDDPNAIQTYIDVFDKGKFLTKNDCLSLSMLRIPMENAEMYFEPTSLKEVYIRMVRNLVNAYQHQQHQNFEHLLTVLELGLIVSPGEPNFAGMTVRLYSHLGINLHEAGDILDIAIVNDPGRSHLYEDMRQMARASLEEDANQEPPEVEPKCRPEEVNADVEYGIGMVMKHRKYDYNCVVYGWDHRCKASQHWIIQMGVNRLPRGSDQPFYNVLVDDGSQRYAAQENLMKSSDPHVVTHPEVGRYYEEYLDGYYRANRELALRYPDDGEFVKQIYDDSDS